MKVEFYGNKMSDRPATYTCEKRYSFIESLIKKHIRTIDILPALRVQAEHAPIWMKEDSHWNNNGIIAAAGMISDSIKHYTKKGTTNFLVKDTCFTYLGDLKSLSGGNDSFTLHTKTIRYGNGSPYVNDTTSSILIFGDSFIDIPGRQNGNLSEFIAYYLGKPVHSHCSVGGNTEGIRLLKKMKKTIVKKKIVVWIFSSRYLYINFSE